jgi:hypothetical protein
MGNGSTRHKPKAKAMPVTALVSGESALATSGGSGQAPLTDELHIPLIRLIEAVLLKATVGDKVEIRLQGGVYEAFMAGNRLGTVPSHYAQDLAPRSSYQGRLSERTVAPLAAVVQVRLHA